MVFKQVENVNYAIAIGKGEFKFSLVGVAGFHIHLAHDRVARGHDHAVLVAGAARQAREVER